MVPHMLTAHQLQSIMPGISPQKRDAFLPFLQAAMNEFAIEAPARAAAFVAQLAHESGQLRFMEEIWGPTDAQRRYEPVSTLAANLGNSEVGDGKRFKGRGPIQITGRANYRRFGDLLGTDLVAEPAKAAIPEVAFRIAGLFWSKKGLNELADRATAEAFREITRRINGGFNGLADRQKFYAVACSVLGVVEAPTTRGGERDFSDTAGEPAFERGNEAIRRHKGRRPTTRKRAKRRKATTTARPRKTTRSRKTVRTSPSRKGRATASHAKRKRKKN
jgi:predicted chitinase